MRGGEGHGDDRDGGRRGRRGRRGGGDDGERPGGPGWDSSRDVDEGGSRPPGEDAGGLSDDEVSRLADKLDLRQKVRLLTGADTWRTEAEPAVGLRRMVFSDGPAGVRGPGWDERDTSALLPSASALAALWDEGLVRRLGALLGDEARRKGVHVLLAPTLNLHRSPLAGRHFECFSEDPLLAGRTGAALIEGIQSRGVAATAKHYVANDSETDRLTLDARIGERVLRELYLAPFEAAVRAGVWLVMSAYNRVNGASMSESSLLAEPLKGEWGFGGAVVSDWGAVRSTTAAGAAAQDLAMPGPSGPWGAELVRAVEAGLVPEGAVADKARRLLRLATRVGALPAPRAPVPGTRAVGPVPDAPDVGPEGALREAVAGSAVLLENRGLLPLDPGTLRVLAVIGAHAGDPRVQGGGSAEVFPRSVVTPLAGLRAALPPHVRVLHAPGPALDDAGPVPVGSGLARDPQTGEPGVRLRVLDARGGVLHSARLPSGRVLEPELPPGADTVELGAVLHPEVSGAWTLGLGGFGPMRLTVDGEPLLDGEFPPETDDPAVIHVRPPLRTGRIHLVAGEEAWVVARRQLAPGAGRATVLAAAPPPPDPAEALAEAEAAARAADAVIVVVGTTDGSESEGADRTGLELPAPQDQVVRAVLRANPRTAVVVNAGGPVELPWRAQAGAVLLSWFPGQEAGSGLADVLLGRAEPGGRLPTTWPARLTVAPVHDTRPGPDGRLPYGEGLHIGHRAWLRTGRTPAYWFGHGLGYTSWAFEELGAREPVAQGREFSVVLRNTGARYGRQLVQVYLARPGSAVDRPVRWLAGWTTVRAEPGERVAAVVRIPARALQYWSPAAGTWVTEPGRYEVLAGPTAGDLPLRAVLDVEPHGAWPGGTRGVAG
ncbi:glycoside hydrolase family 3 C-terminal domain-containing protein [Streptomyces sp. G-G2]|uniref:glycoside hydrolase family 3 C-terminal domain-containing protein n=1 Tax=Streptomyces sp. G-G2 TaxID=3046201 RepID=UPI0024B9CFD1|nr:glycoside hydrolase family 3 C-terminal domain-containing protein [Streptomyces sp. G-G2]MDJ0383109.1 glycoside hydrolase family 3 C-terminal domain-containing protein [Streptomyces sp. G-G2]